MSDESQSTEGKSSRKRGLDEEPQSREVAREASYTRQDAKVVRAELTKANGVERVSDEAVILEMQRRAREADAEAVRQKRARAYDDIDDEDSSSSTETYSESVGGDDDFTDSDDEEDDESDESDENDSSSSDGSGDDNEAEASEVAKESDDEKSESTEVDGDFVSAAACDKQATQRRSGRQSIQTKGVGEHDAIQAAVQGNWKALEAFVEMKQLSPSVQTGAPLDEKRKEIYQELIKAANAGTLKLVYTESAELEPCRMCGTLKPCAFSWQTGATPTRADFISVQPSPAKPVLHCSIFKLVFQ